MGLSIRAYARHRGVTDTAVHKAIRVGRITQEADGTIDPHKADLEWARNTDAPKTETPRGQPVPPRDPEPVAAAFSRDTAAPRDVPRDSATTTANEPAPSLPGGGTSLLQARTVNEVVKAQTNKVRLARLKGELVDRSQAVAQVFKLARTERDAWLNWPARISAQLAANLGVDPHHLHVALDAAVREHLQELGDLRPTID